MTGPTRKKPTEPTKAELERRLKESEKSSPALPLNAELTEPPSVRLARPDSGTTPDQNLWTLIRNRTNAISFNNYEAFVNEVLGTATGAKSIDRNIDRFTFLGADGFELLQLATRLFLQQEVALVVEDNYANPKRTTKDLQDHYELTLDRGSESRRRNNRGLSQKWLVDLREEYLQDLGENIEPKMLPYLKTIISNLKDLPIKQPDEAPDVYGVLPSRLVGPLGLELIWNYWHEEGMLVQAHNAVTNRFQNLRTVPGRLDPLARLELDPLRRLNNVIWGWIQNRPFLLSVRRRAFEYDHHYGMTLLGTAVGDVDGVDSRSQFISAFHNLLHLCTIFYQQDDDLTMQADGFPLLNALRETQLVVTAGAHNQYGDLPWTARVEMLMQMWMFARPEMREFLGGRVMVPYKEAWMDRVDSVKSMMGWSDVNVTHFRDLGTFGEQIVLGIRFGDWANTIEPESAVNWARYWRPEIQGYVHAYRAATGADLRSTVDTTMPGVLLQKRLPEQLDQAPRRQAIERGNGQVTQRALRGTVHETTRCRRRSSTSRRATTWTSGTGTAGWHRGGG
jgi:hypothetical protein